MNKQLLKETIGQEIDISDLQKLTGSSGCEVYLLGDSIYKVGPRRDIEEICEVYSKFQNQIPSYRLIFPAIEPYYVSDIDKMVLKIEYCGSKNFEQLLLENHPTKDDCIITVIFAHKKTLQHLRTIFEESILSSSEPPQAEANQLFYELLEALRVNLSKAGILNSYPDLIKKIALSRDRFTEKFIPSLAHRDLSVGNILISD